MSAGDTQPTLPLPDWEPAEAPRRRRWPWLVALGVVIVLLVAAWFAAEALARQLVVGVVRDQVQSQLGLPADQQIDVEIPGAIIPQLIGGTLHEITIASDDVVVAQFAGDVSVTAYGVPIRGGSMSDGTATVTLAEEQLRTLLATIDQFPSGTVEIDEPGVSMTMDLQLFGLTIPVGASLTPAAVEGDIILTPTALSVGGAEVDADALRNQFGGVADTVLRDWTLCIAQYIPAGATLTDVAVDDDTLVADFDIDGDIMSDPALRAQGVCD
ncbi:DUF2993 domain-containing protein [Microbacterium sp. HD4P20]|uniref:LmeA family phospholipid-binding protein n=1 Tax=Microbacterium sp. HD4P20 TaxID=2864874 RepID=UPI001C6404B4|nr:DUF2993 domain-containing protein [Microbacterium sp. HD4P20]MCP2637399.1 DUF2993 domain-containing protein [Microbacterium sp. HD4P20]